VAQKRDSAPEAGKGPLAGGNRPLSGEADNRWSTPPEGVAARGIAVQDVMTEEVFTVAAGAPATEAARLMRDNDVGFLPVVQSDGAVVGVVTDRDLVVRLLAEGFVPDTAVEQVMSDELVTCHAGDDLAVCEQLMRANQLKRMVVLGDDNHLAGVVSLADLAENTTEAAVGAVVADVTSQAPEPH
jgi:CBS domain-containing protein